MKIYASLGIGSFALIILFILKVVGLTDMHWFWVLTSWIWVPIGALLAGMFLMLCFGVMIIIFATLLGR